MARVPAETITKGFRSVVHDMYTCKDLTQDEWKQLVELTRVVETRLKESELHYTKDLGVL